jgi:SAM-dependent methyltransferase
MNAVLNQATPAASAVIDEGRLHELMGRVLVDFGAAYLAPLIVIGDRLGLYKTLARIGPCSSAELASATGTAERYVREWLNAHAASHFITYEPVHGHYWLSPEQTMVFADEDSPAFIAGGFQAALAAGRIVDRATQAFLTGEGIGWHEHDHDVFHGVERFYRTGYLANLVQKWIPALDGVEAKLRAGARVADVGCGHGASTILMAQAFPASGFTGFDFHRESVAEANRRARAAGIADRCRFEVARAKDFPGKGYDFIATFDALHDMGDPTGAARHARAALAANGTWMIVEPFAADRTEDNFNPVGRAFYAASTLICTPCSLSQEVGLALGAQAGEARTRAVVTAGGFTRFRTALATPVNLIYEARP